MKLKRVTLKNYRSIEDVNFDLEPLEDGSFTYGLIGVNEAGKSSILKGLGLQNANHTFKISIKDFHDKSKPIEIEYHYTLMKEETLEYLDILKSNNVVSSSLPFQVNLNEIVKVVTYNSSNLNSSSGVRFPISVGDLSHEMLGKILNILTPKFHRIIFWTADVNYLISGAINLTAFAANPDTTSIPLKNCFILAGITADKIKERIALVTDSTEREELRELLGSKVTEHIRSVWPKHPIKITFDISDGNIYFHIHDEHIKGKSKTTDQRSDGFRQFISFLLTVSAESKNEALANTIILLDEPETHLHPTAQQDLLKELAMITKNDKNNVVFFATHSNYMVDKIQLDRNYKIEKPKDKTTVIRFDKKTSTYASVNYDAFNIVSTDYHNELFAQAQEKSGFEKGTEFDNHIKELIPTVIIKSYKKGTAKPFDCTLPTYIRHQIHHPENSLNPKFTLHELEQSIQILLNYLIL